MKRSWCAWPYALWLCLFTIAPLLFALGLAKSEPWALGVLIAACLLALACLFVLRKPAA